MEGDKKERVNRLFSTSQNTHPGPNFSNFNIKALINDRQSFPRKDLCGRLYSAKKEFYVLSENLE